MNSFRRVFLSRIIGAMTGLVYLPGCSRQQDSSPVVSIQQMQPSGEVPLLAGETVTFAVDVLVQGLKTEGEIGLVIQAADGVVLGGCEPIKVADGVTTKLTASAVIPETESVRVFVPLYVAASNKTDVIDMRKYKVVGKHSNGEKGPSGE